MIEILKNKGIKVINADDLAHQAYEPGNPAFNKILAEFGRDFLGENGQIDRKKLARLVFTDDKARARLERIVHPVVLDALKDRLKYWAGRGEKLVVVEIQLLYEAGWESLFDQIWVVTAPEAEQLQRLKSRDQLSEENAVSRIKAQLPLNYKEKKADVVINNCQGLTDLKKQVERLLAGMLDSIR